VNVFHEQALKFLTSDADLTEMLRTMYRTGVDYCVILPFWNSRDYVVFTKDQLVLLIERGIPDVRVADIPRLAAEGIFKPLLFSDRPAVPNDADMNPDELQVLVIDDEEVGLSSLREALMSREPDFPAWWEAPVPLVMRRRRRTYANAAAERIFGEELQGLPRDFPEKDEFLLNLQGGQTPRSLMFHRLEDDIFTLEDCTGDVLAAADIAWWAAVGKAWIAILDKGKRVYRRYEKAEIESMEEEELAVLSAENTLIPCEWENGLLGYLCVRKRVAKKERFEQPPSEKTKTEKTKTGRAEARKPGRPARKRVEADRPAREEASGETPENPPREENEILEVLGPQAMGLLAPGTVFSAAEGAVSAENAEKGGASGEEQPRSSPRGKRRARKGARPGGEG
jgi:hypothetical protein